MPRFQPLWNTKLTRNRWQARLIPNLSDEQLELLPQIPLGGASRAHVRAQHFEEACLIINMAQAIIGAALSNQFPPYDMIWALEERIQIFLQEMLPIQYIRQYDHRAALRRTNQLSLGRGHTSAPLRPTACYLVAGGSNDPVKGGASRFSIQGADGNPRCNLGGHLGIVVRVDHHTKNHNKNRKISSTRV